MLEKLSNFCVIEGKAAWNQYKEQVATAIGAEETIVTPTKLEFPSEPKEYPCLVATIVVRTNPMVEGSLAAARVCGCFVYPSDAQSLLDVCVDTDHQVPVPAKVVPVAEEPRNDKKADAEFLVTLFALIKELESVGAIKRESLSQAMNFAETWLRFSGVEGKDLNSMLKSFWKEVDSNAG